MIYTAYGGLYISILTDQVQGGSPSCLAGSVASCLRCCIAPRTAAACTNIGWCCVTPRQFKQPAPCHLLTAMRATLPPTHTSTAYLFVSLGTLQASP